LSKINQSFKDPIGNPDKSESEIGNELVTKPTRQNPSARAGFPRDVWHFSDMA
jgi:hypothetical protein